MHIPNVCIKNIQLVLILEKKKQRMLVSSHMHIPNVSFIISQVWLINFDQNETRTKYELF